MDSFQQLAEQYEPMIHKIINSLHIYKDRDEYLQIGRTGLWEAANTYNPDKGGFLNYAFTYVRGQILNEMNRNIRREERVVHPKEEYWETVEEYYPGNPLETEILLGYCNGLSEKETKWVLYHFIDFLSVKDIAEKENVSPSAVKQWRAGALKKLRSRHSSTN
ncbi:sigma-70 family RNA polymerase sigma factor [Bacillus sp. REN3]|uniref:sigma-70 family RNA polymerase sigma factor n=1 Tax=Bacillus sp. REN3 TaxID=2802440 RepID=UPI001AEE6101|nr:sigma-70 family RNA polymerase sigma factor [Bacillus sp. REN3]